MCLCALYDDLLFAFLKILVGYNSFFFLLCYWTLVQIYGIQQMHAKVWDDFFMVACTNV